MYEQLQPQFSAHLLKNEPEIVFNDCPVIYDKTRTNFVDVQKCMQFSMYAGYNNAQGCFNLPAKSPYCSISSCTISMSMSNFVNQCSAARHKQILSNNTLNTLYKKIISRNSTDKM